MPRTKRKTATETLKPLISFEKIAYEKATFKLTETVLQQLTAYAAYVKTSTGQEPTPDEVVDKGMQRLFDADKGFKQWLQQQHGTDPNSENETNPDEGKDKPAAALFNQL